MREIKFRAWDKEVKKMFYSCDTFLNQFVDFHWHKFLMQFTGLKDKNGKDIYEGDILRNIDIVGEVYFDEVFVQYRFHWNCCLHKNNCEILEIIGNIYENPELLKDNQKEGKDGRNN